jgi:hypothetical protein
MSVVGNLNLFINNTSIYSLNIPNTDKNSIVVRTFSLDGLKTVALPYSIAWSNINPTNNGNTKFNVHFQLFDENSMLLPTNKNLKYVY